MGENGKKLIYNIHTIWNDRRLAMGNNRSRSKEYIFAASLGAIGGGIIVAIATRAIPKMMSKIKAGMMQNMMAQMTEGECKPVDI